MSIFHVLEWSSEDVSLEGYPGRFVVTCFGRDLQGRTCSASFDHLPRFLVRSEKGRSASTALEAVFEIFGENVHETSAVVYGKPFTGWQEEDSEFALLVFRNRRTFRQAGELFRKPTLSGRCLWRCPSHFSTTRLEYDTYELDADCLLQALTSRGIPPTGWVRVESDKVLSPHAMRSRCDVHYEEVPTAIADEDVPEISPPHVVATFDIEVFSSRSTWEDQIFPDAAVRDDVVTQIVVFFSRFGEKLPYAGTALVLLNGGPPPPRSRLESLVEVDVQYFEKESRLLEAWVRLFAEHKATVWSHFNGLGFDEPYLFARCELHSVDLSLLSYACRSRMPSLHEQKLESNAYGYNEFKTIELPGVFHMDVHQDIKKNHNLEAYSLAYCAEKFLPDGERKEDLKPQEQFECFRANDVSRLLDYCTQDVVVTYLLAEKLSVLQSMLETAAVSWVTATYLVTRGQQVRVYNCIKKEIYGRGENYYLRDTKYDPPVENGYKGATVLDPEKGFYPRAIVSLDFASLYPSIMMQYNLSHETWTDSPGEDARFYKTSDSCGFLRHHHRAGIMPSILTRLKESRKKYKMHMMKYEKLAHEAVDKEEKLKYKFMEKLYDAKQKATKVTMNSAYGFAGVSKNGKQPCLPLASTVTTIGRELIAKTKIFCEKHVPGSKVIYGDTDSVMWNIWPEREVNQDTVKEAFIAAEEAVKAIAPIYEHDGNSFVVLEFENVYVNYLLVAKKIYSTLQYSADLGWEKPKKTVQKGLRCVRRDTVEFVRKSQLEVLDHLAHNRVEEAKNVGKDAVKKLFSGEVKFEELIMSKKLSSTYTVNAEKVNGEKVKVKVTPHGKWKIEETGETGTCDIEPGEPWQMRITADGAVFGKLTLAQPHVHVMHKMEKRAQNSGPRVGDRVRYVFISGKKLVDKLQICRSEDPEFAAEQGLSPDTVYYFEHALRNPLETVLEVFTSSPYNTLGWRTEHVNAVNAARGQKSLADFGFCFAPIAKKTSRVAKISKKRKK